MMKATLSKSGIPCLWEQGGGASNTGDAQLICRSDGAAKKPIYIPTRGSLSCGQHALIPVGVGDLIIFVDHHRRDFNVKINKIVNITGDDIDTETIHTYHNGRWDVEPDDNINEVVDAACEKATDYHCRSTYWVKEV